MMNWTLSAFLYFYFVFVGICYILGFWTPLHFNILEYLSPIDIIKSATYPVIPAALGIFFWVGIDSFNSQGTKRPESDDPKIIKLIFWVLITCAILLLLFNIASLVSYLYYFFTTEPEKRLSYALPAASIVGILYFLQKPIFLIEQHKLIRNFVIIFICVLPTLSYFQGNRNILEILKGNSKFHYLKKNSKNCLIDDKSKMIYLGYFGSNYFFVNSSNKDICIEKDGGISLSFNENKEKAPYLDIKDDEKKAKKYTPSAEKGD